MNKPRYFVQIPVVLATKTMPQNYVNKSRNTSRRCSENVSFAQYSRVYDTEKIRETDFFV